MWLPSPIYRTFSYLYLNSEYAECTKTDSNRGPAFRDSTVTISCCKYACHSVCKAVGEVLKRFRVDLLVTWASAKLTVLIKCKKTLRSGENGEHKDRRAPAPQITSCRDSRTRSLQSNPLFRSIIVAPPHFDIGSTRNIIRIFPVLNARIAILQLAIAIWRGKGTKRFW